MDELLMITKTAFQIGAFQFSAFQEAQTVVGSGGWLPFWLLMRQYEQARKAKKKKKKEEPITEQVVEHVTLRFAPVTMRKREIVDLGYSLRAIIEKPVIDEAKELAEFHEFMELIVKMDELA